MQVIFESRHATGSTLRQEALERVRFVLRRLGATVPRTKVMFTDINGPKGGVDKHCLLEVKTEKSGVLVISSLASDWRTALDDGLERLVRALTRTMDRQRKPTRTRLAQPTLEVN